MSRSHLAGVILLGTTALGGLAAPASAMPYSFATQNITNFNLTATVGSYTIPGGGAQDTGVSTNTSTYSGVSNNTLDSKPFGTLANAAEATSGPGPFPASDNYSTNAGRTLGMNGARGDSWITTGNGQSVAETQITSGGPAAAASGKGTSSWGIIVSNGTILNFSFNDDVYLQATTANPGEASDASIATAYSLTDAAGTTIFNFTPDGSGAGNVVGGTTSSNPFNLQSAISSVSGFPANSQTGNTAGTDSFSATTGPLAAGNYLVHVRETSQSDAQIGVNQPVPEPMSLALLGAGLAVTGLVRRRKQKQ